MIIIGFYRYTKKKERQDQYEDERERERKPYDLLLSERESHSDAEVLFLVGVEHERTITANEYNTLFV